MLFSLYEFTSDDLMANQDRWRENRQLVLSGGNADKHWKFIDGIKLGFNPIWFHRNIYFFISSRLLFET
jgi:hypothetical protein